MNPDTCPTCEREYDAENEGAWIDGVYLCGACAHAARQTDEHRAAAIRVDLAFLHDFTGAFSA